LVKRKEGIENQMETEEVVISAADIPEVVVNAEENPKYESLFVSAQEVRKSPDVLGYILRGEAKATVDIHEPEKIVEYAVMSSQAFESSELMAESLGLGEIENIVVEGKTLKVLCLNLGENKLSVFMQKAAPHEWLLETFLLKS
jgi:hypothetical protein